jgi:hypothetical protein
MPLPLSHGFALFSRSPSAKRWEGWECLTAAAIFGGNGTNKHSHQETPMPQAYSHPSHHSAE